MSERKEDWIYIKKPDGAVHIAAPSYINTLLGVDTIKDKVDRLFYRMQSLEHQVHILESPMRQDSVIKLLSENDEPHAFSWLENRVRNLTYMDMTTLEEKGLIEITKSGTHTMYSINNQEKRSTQ